MEKSKLDIEVIHRKGFEDNNVIVHESYSVDFIINGSSLLSTIIKIDGGPRDFMGCFARGWINLNNNSKKQLLLLEYPTIESGRRLIYVCPECADVGCGAYGCMITKKEDFYIWSDFAYENDYEEPRQIEKLGPFRFKDEEYEKIIEYAYAI